MDAEIFYPVGIGKHIVCIDAGQSAAGIQTACRGANSEPQGECTGKQNTADEHRRCELSAVIHRPQKERAKLKPTTKQK